jgi:hypothetical protein
MATTKQKFIVENPKIIITELKENTIVNHSTTKEDYRVTKYKELQS